MRFDSLTSTERYLKDKEKLNITGEKRAKRIYFYIFLFCTIIAWPYLIYVAIRYVKESSHESAERALIFSKFAVQNGFVFKNNERKTIIVDRDVDKTLNLPFKAEHTTHLNVLSGNILGHAFQYSLSSIFIPTSRGLSQWPSIIFSINLPVVLPRMFLNSKSNNLPGLDADAINFDQSQDHVLEGDFPDYYNVRIERDQQIDMYTILTPEVMETLKQNNQYDVWLNGQQLVFITFGDQPRYFAGTPAVFKNVYILMKEIDRVARAIRQ